MPVTELGAADSADIVGEVAHRAFNGGGFRVFVCLVPVTVGVGVVNIG